MKRTIHEPNVPRAVMLILSLTGLLQIFASIGEEKIYDGVMIFVMFSGICGVVTGLAFERFFVFGRYSLWERADVAKIVGFTAFFLYFIFAAFAYLFAVFRNLSLANKSFAITGTMFLGATVVMTFCIITTIIILISSYKLFRYCFVF